MQKKIWFIILYFVLFTTQQQLAGSSSDDDNPEDDDECAFISGQHCDQNGICKYCAMCLQSSCILSKTTAVTNSCNTTQFGINIYNWYDYCLSSENDSSGSYCATSTECYQYRKSTEPTITYAWHNLTCSPTTCMLVASNGSPPPTPIPPPSLATDSISSTNNNSSSHRLDTNSNDHHYNPFHNPTTIALTIVCCLVLLIGIFWILRVCKKYNWFIKRNRSHPSMPSIPSTAPPSFSSMPPQQQLVPSGRSSTNTQNGEALPSYLSTYYSPPKYEQAIVTQIRGLRDDSTSDLHHQAAPSMWVPVYFTNGRRGNELFGFTPNHPYWIQSQNPFDDQHQSTQQDP